MEQMTLNLPQMLNERQAARLLACSVAALRRWRREGRGPAIYTCGDMHSLAIDRSSAGLWKTLQAVGR